MVTKQPAAIIAIRFDFKDMAMTDGFALLRTLQLAHELPVWSETPTLSTALLPGREDTPRPGAEASLDGRAASRNQRHDEEDQKDKEQDLGNFRCQACDADEPQHARDNGDN